jgi:hypothetical protein
MQHEQQQPDLAALLTDFMLDKKKVMYIIQEDGKQQTVNVVHAIALAVAACIKAPANCIARQLTRALKLQNASIAGSLHNIIYGSVGIWMRHLSLSFRRNRDIL